MKERDGFIDEFTYHEYLKTQYERGKLQLETVDKTSRNEVLAKLLGPLQAGIYTEIGPALFPYSAGSNRKFNAEARYVGIDGGQSRYALEDYSYMGVPRGWGDYTTTQGKYFMRYAAEVLASDQNADFSSLVWSDAQALPFLDFDKTETPIRETFMRDVLLAPFVHPDSIKRIIREQARTLAADGQLIIQEKETPLNPSQPNSNVLVMLNILEGAGFYKRVVVFERDEEVDKLRAQFTPAPDRDQRMGFYLICERGEKPEKENWRSRLGGLTTRILGIGR